MLNSKMINPEILKTDKDKKGPNRLVKFIENVCGKLSRIKIKFRPFGYHSLPYEIANDGLSLGWAIWWGRIWDAITFSQFRYRLKMGLQYFKQGWGSHDFDSAYALDDFMWKLKRLADHIEEDELHIGYEKDVKQIRKLLELMDKVREDNYDTEAFAEIDKKWGPRIYYHAHKDDLFNSNVPALQDGHSISISKHEKENDSNSGQIRKETRAAFRKAERQRMKDWKAALKIMEEHFFCWWD